MSDDKHTDVGLLFLHALPLDGSMWSEFADLMPGATFAPTLYGFGDTLQEWARGALQSANSRRLIVVGCSVGGSCALEIAAIAPDRVAALVLIATKAAHRPDPALRDAVIETLEREGIQKAWTDYWATLLSPKVGLRVADHAKSIALRQSLQDIARGVAVFHSRPGREAFAATWPKETIIISGEHDSAPGVDHSIALAKSMQNSRCEIIEGSGHYVPLEQPEALKKILKQLIETV